MTRKREAISIWEWVAAALSAGMVLTAAGVLVVHAWRERTPPDLRVSVESVEQVRSGFLVRFHVLNEGGRTAAGATIRGVLSAAGQEEESEAVLDYVPAGSFRRGGLFFAGDPRQGHLSLRALGLSRALSVAREGLPARRALALFAHRFR